MNMAGQSIVVSPANDIEDDIAQPVCRKIQEVFGFPARIRPLLSDVDFAYNPDRNQYHSTRILEKLAEKAPSGILKIIAFTRQDLYIPILTHVYGEAQLGGKACVVSTLRLKENLSALHPRKIFLSRVTKEAIHELGHTFNLRHCPDPACIMHYCRSIEDVDGKSEQLCRYCKVLLGDERKKLNLCG